MQHIISISRKANPYCDCYGFNSYFEVPEYTRWLATHGVKKTDYTRLVEPWVADANRYADRCLPYTILSIVSCGLAGWCCQLAEIATMNRRGQNAVDKFNSKYKISRVRVDATSSGLVFTKLR